MKKFFAEFKKFVTRGNVIDMAVGVTVGGAFTAIVNALTDSILKPFINWIIAIVVGDDTLTSSFTFLGEPVRGANGEIDLTQSIYIDWGAFINAVINFIIIAFVLFCIVKAINSIVDKQISVTAKLMENVISSADKKAMKKQGINIRNKEEVKAYFDAKAAEEARIRAEEEEKARLEREANPTTEELLKQIRDLLKDKQ